MLELNFCESKFTPCKYSVRLLNKLSFMNKNILEEKNKINLLEVKKAIYYAKKYHGEQKRDSGELFYTHPLEVAYMTVNYNCKTDTVITSVLHDTIEDTNFQEKEIESAFGSTISKKVENLTRIKKYQKITSLELVESLLHQKKDDLLLIKFFDRLHNMQTIRFKSIEKIKKIKKETLKIFFYLASYLKIGNKEQNQLMGLCRP